MCNPGKGMFQPRIGLGIALDCSPFRASRAAWLGAHISLWQGFDSCCGEIPNPPR